jgi:hypothetical protein
MPAPYDFDRFLRYEELTTWLDDVAAAHPDLVTVESYGHSHEGRDLWVVTITDSATGAHATKPAHWVDASIHAVELTATVAACYLIQRLVSGHVDADPTIRRALATRTFYVVPRVNPDGAEWVLADRPKFRRSSTRPWPWSDAHQWPGLHLEDIDGDGRILDMRIADPDGAWTPHPEDERLLVPVPPGGVPEGTPRFRVLREGVLADHDGFTIPTPRAVEGLDLNRNFPAGWGTGVPGSGDHPMSEPEIRALVAAIVARPNICGYHAFHTSGGVLIRPSSTATDATLPPVDLWVWKQFAEAATARTGYPPHSAFEDFTFDKSSPMSGAADDWAYEHLGVYAWTTEFWDVVHAATGSRQATDSWYVWTPDDQALAVLRWLDEHHPAGYVDWYPYDHRQLGPVELGGWNELTVWTNPPPHMLRAEVAPHADVVVDQALASPRLELRHQRTTALGDETWRVEVGVANTGFLPTYVTEWARKRELVRPIVAEITGADGAAIDVVGGPARVQLGQLEGRAAARFHRRNDGTPDRTLVSWVVRAAAGTSVTVTAKHDRSGEVSGKLELRAADT